MPSPTIPIELSLLGKDDPAVHAYRSHYAGARLELRFPAEYLVRIFMGRYPRLSLEPGSYAGATLLEVGFGDGRNLPLFEKLGCDVHGVEIASDICDRVRKQLLENGVSARLIVGFNDALPYPDAYFEYLVSWNSCYYLRPPALFEDHVREFTRVLKPGGLLVLSVPQPSNYLYREVETVAEGIVRVIAEPFGVLKGVLLQYYETAIDWEAALGKGFSDFRHAGINADCFGVQNDHFLMVARRATER